MSCPARRLCAINPSCSTPLSNNDSTRPRDHFPHSICLLALLKVEAVIFNPFQEAFRKSSETMVAVLTVLRPGARDLPGRLVRTGNGCALGSRKTRFHEPHPLLGPEPTQVSQMRSFPAGDVAVSYDNSS